MRKKLENHEYSNASKFFDDFKLMIRNCFTFNPAGTPVNQAGIELQRLFDEKWKNLPPLREVSEEEYVEEEDESEEERNRGSIVAQYGTHTLMSCPTQVGLRQWRHRSSRCEEIYSH